MSLATRCSACGTIFRVVEDQLRVSDGWVRCGRCAEVFDARAQLFDIDREAPPPWPAEAPPAPAAQTLAPIGQPHDTPEATPRDWPPEATKSEFEPEFEPRPSQFTADRSTHAIEPELDAAPGNSQESGQNSRFDSRLDSRLEPHWSDEPLPPASAAAPVPAQAPALAESAPLMQPSQAEPPAKELDPNITDRPDVVLGERLTKIGATAPTPAEAAALPEFLRAQAAKTKWHSVKWRMVLSLLALLLLIGLLFQVGLHFRNTLAALHLGLRPALHMACSMTGCEIAPRQYLEGIGVESSALNQAGSGNHYQLMVGLRNKSNTEVATPWVDVSLTDSAGALVAKRVLGPADFKTDKLAMAAGSDLNLQTLISTGDARVSGYSVEIFYP
jgi:predicted Zn finger-like uncharacterized protein